ncbi:MAG: hypothetical protein IJX17_00810 [Clostridia bacterium]|nr:hypothetical protein [Clostridia bacterium]
MDEKLLEELIKGYREELADLEEIRAENAARYAGLSEEEYVDQLTKDYEEVYEHAKNNGVTIAVIPSKEDEEETEE